MSLRYADRCRHRLPLPPEQRAAQQPFVLDALSALVTEASRPGDEERLEALLDVLDPDALPAAVCWVWPDRDPVPITGTPPGWACAGRGQAAQNAGPWD